MSQYQLKFTGNNINEAAVQKFRENLWWVGRFVSAIGWDQAVYVEIRDNNNSKKENLESKQSEKLK